MAHISGSLGSSVKAAASFIRVAQRTCSFICGDASPEGGVLVRLGRIMPLLTTTAAPPRPLFHSGYVVFVCVDRHVAPGTARAWRCLVWSARSKTA